MSDVQVTFGANIGEFLAGQKEIQSHLTQIRYALWGLTEPVRGIRSSLGELSEAFIAAFAVDKIAGFVSEYAELGEHIKAQAATLGMSAEQYQLFGYAAQMSGEDAGNAADAIQRFEYNLQQAQNPTSRQAQALHALGLSAHEFIGIPVAEQMERLFTAVSHFADGGNKTAAVEALLTRYGVDMIPVMDQGAAGFERMSQRAKEAGVVMSGPVVNSLAALEEDLTTMWASFKAMSGTVVAELSPSFESFVQILTDMFAAFTKNVEAGGSMKVALDLIAAALSAVDAALSIGIAGIEAFWQTGVAAAQDIASIWTATGRILADVFTFKWADVGAAWSAFEGEFAAHGRELANNYAADIKQAVGEIRTALYGDEAAPAQKPGLPQVPAMNVNASLDATEMQSHYQALITQIDGFYNRQKEELAAAVAEHRMSYDQETAALLRALEARHAGEDAAYDAEIAAVKAAGKNYEAVVKEKLATDQKYALEHQKIVDEAAIKETKEWQKTWQSALSTIESSFNSQLRGLLAGTTTWNMAWKKMLGDMIIKFIEMCETMVVKWAAVELAKTTATITGAAARTAAEQTASAAGVLGMIGNAIKAIMVDAGQAFAGVFAFLAPTMGPAAAAPAAAAQASVMGAAVFDVGTNYVVRGGLALIHPGETIIPAARGSGPFTGAGTSPQVHAPVSISVSALDSQSVKRFFDDNSHHLMRAINDAVKRGAHLRMWAGARGSM
jgi:hypothetical protein